MKLRHFHQPQHTMVAAYFCFVIFLVLPFNVIDCRSTTTSAGSPVILVPGDGGSHLDAKLNKSSVVHYICTKVTDDYFNIWLNLELMFPYVLDCWVDNVRLVYDNRTRLTSNSPGVDIQITDFGNTGSVEWLDPSKASQGAYFKDIVDALVAVGYQRGVSVRGAPYDFRKAPSEARYELSEYFVNLTRLIEETYTSNGNQRVVLISHSMGGRFLHFYLHNQPKSWKQKYISSLISLAGVWGGAVKAMKVYSSGDNLGIYVLSAWTLRTEQISNPSLAFLLPSKNFWSPDEILVSTATRNYTVNDLPAYFHDLDNSDAYNMWLDTKDLVDELLPPQVEVHCLYGVNVNTEERIGYSAIPSSSPTITYGPGDGTVNLRSLEGCLRWNGSQAEKVHSLTFDQVDHMGIIRHPDVVKYILSVVLPTR